MPIITTTPFATPIARVAAHPDGAVTVYLPQGLDSTAIGHVLDYATVLGELAQCPRAKRREAS